MRSRAALLLSLLSTYVSATAVMDKIIAAKNAINQVGRINALDDKDFVFDFLHPEAGESKGAGGHTVAASASNFPGIIGNGMAMTIGFLEACGLNSPHTHPRATEFNFAVNGTLVAGMLAENGARFVFNEVPPGSATVFPKGAIHFEMNNDCEPMIFVAAFNDEDPGVLQVAQRFFGIKPEFVAASFGSLGVEQVAGLEALIPDNVALGVDECLARCGIKRDYQPTAQRQPRLPTNALPSGFYGPPPAAPPSAAPPAASSSGYASPSTAPSGGYASPPIPSLSIPKPQPSAPATNKAANNFAESAPSSSSSTTDLLKEPTVIVLIVLVAVLASGYVVLGIMYVLRQKKGATQWKPVAGREYGLDKGAERYDPPLRTSSPLADEKH